MVNTFEGLLGVLVASRVRFTVVGGLAVALNGSIRTTEDLDILVDDTSENLEKLLKCLLDFGEGYARELQIEDFVDEEGAVRIQEDFALDVFVRMRGNKYKDLVNHTRYHRTAEGLEIPYLNAEGLILLKDKSAREKDRIDVAALAELASQESEEKTKDEMKFPLDSLRSMPADEEAGPDTDE